MILGTLHNIEKERAFYPAAIQKGLEFLRQHDLQKMADGKYAVEGEAIFAKLASYKTQPAAERRPERHEKYLDIQYIIEGAEMIGAGLQENAGAVAEDKMQANDILYYAAMADEVPVTLQAGMFAVYFPWDVHRPNCNAGMETQSVRKAVVKVAMSALNK